MARQPIGVVFDMDGVLVDSADAHFRGWQLLGEEQGRAITREQFSATFGRHNGDIVPLLFDVHEPTQVQALADRKEALYRELIRADPPIIDGAVQLIRSLHEAGVALAVGSSGPRQNIQLVLDTLHASDLISVVVSGDDVVRGKPDPEVFSLACGRLGLEPRRCVVVEDAPVGVDAARAAGAHTVAVLIHHPAEAFHQTDLTISKLADLTVAHLTELVAS